MAVWETDDEHGGPVAATALPTPRDTPHRTPSRSSRKSRRSVTPPNGKKSPSPPPVPNEKSSKRSSRNITNEDNISVLDPRRFTPTLHANLVAEILNLRRDQEEKTKLIENLEVSLHASREEQESLQESVATTTKESRSLKRQLALLEGGTSSALGELARERDEAVDSITETKKRLEAAQKKIRSQEEAEQKIHDLWSQDKDSWEEEKRKYERRIHVAESRLKVVLDEVTAYQAAQANGHAAESDMEDNNDAASVRTMSMTNSVRFSMQQSPGKVNNVNSLADELNLDGDDDWQTDDGGRESALSFHRHTRNMSRESVLSRIHRRNQSLESPQRPGSVTRGRLWMNQPVLEALEDGIQEDDEDLMPPPPPPAPKVTYTDTGIQFSPPPSPQLEPIKPSTPEPPAKMEELTKLDEPVKPEKPAEVEYVHRESEIEAIEANQRRKRVQINRPLSIEPRPYNHMVSAGSQTVEEPLSPPKTPKSPYRSTTPPPPEIPAPVMASSSTQTDFPEPEPEEKPQPLPELKPVQELLIPSISIIPPTSRPTTPREPRLPQYTKDFGCQVSIIASAPMKSTAVQTEEILVDKRLANLPAHLRPSAISSRPSSPNIATAITTDDPRHFTPVPNHLPPRNPRRLATKRSLTDMPSSPPTSPMSPMYDVDTKDAYPGNNDDGPLSGHKAPMRRPHRISSLFAGFDEHSSDEQDEFADADVSDSEYRTVLTAPGMRMTDSRASNRTSVSTFAASPASPEQALKKSAIARGAVRSMGPESYGFSQENKEMGSKKAPMKSSARGGYDRSNGGPSSRPNGMRKAALIQSGISSHQGRPRSPSIPEAQPPFPIPTRASSRRPPFSASAPSDGQRSPTKMDAPWHRRGIGRSHYRANSIRKTRSAAALPRTQRNRRHGSRSPPPIPQHAETPESPGLPPLPYNDITSPRYDTSSNYRSHRSRLSTNTAQTATTDLASVGGVSQSAVSNGATSNAASSGAASNGTNGTAQATGVVDAIAQTMVGEWMFKYVRRRKSFGVSDGGKDDSSNDRHKRWVWLAPYERAILWSSKQPNSGNALLGKPGRKLTIQSVLDVKDDNPPPRGQGNVFNRSILILTPQRALKFTATTSERHYVWLTALSFLAHSTQALPEITPSPQPVKETTVPDFEMPQPNRRTGIRDSIRLTKSKAPVIRDAAPSVPSVPSIPSVPSVPSIPSSRVGDSGNYRQQEQYAPMPNINNNNNTNTNTHQRERSERSIDAAEPPFIPRFTERGERGNPAGVHGRKRSNTGGHVPPPLSFRGFSGPGSIGQHSYTNSNAGNSVGTAGSSDIYQSHQSQPSTGGAPSWPMSTAGSQRTSEASSRPGANFFDAIGTVRMEAFISPLAYSRFDGDPDEHEEYRYRARRRSKELRRRQSRSRHRDSYSSRGTRTTDGYYSRMGTEDDFFRDDPFKGF
ncbi:Nuclear migration protein NUM1 [Colletotrichum siamense]|uniref:Nuclear migration protein NUM1 n=1 Tax=Colletotrichum siamense TaxID=690259 RepID=UPI0018722716|nr:Nuclear migration protein NUM1 [Colletotrichum siamense]KAF5487654.1 Nuclear migration protein NUM1 [Colletotrichum siamense]